MGFLFVQVFFAAGRVAGLGGQIIFDQTLNVVPLLKRKRSLSYSFMAFLGTGTSFCFLCLHLNHDFSCY